MNPKTKSLLISNNKLNKSKIKLFHMHKSSIEEENISNLSSSFFYSIGKLFKNKIGNNGDLYSNLFVYKELLSGILII